MARTILKTKEIRVNKIVKKDTNGNKAHDDDGEVMTMMQKGHE